VPRGAVPRTVAGLAVSTRGVLFVAGFEGFSSCPYWDPYGRVSTRGYGETDFGDTFGGRCISRSFGLANLRNLLNRNYLYPIRQIGGSYNQCMVDAMGSASYNLGPGIIFSLAGSFRAHNAYPLLGYVHAGGVTLPGLVRRRHAEVALFYSHGCTPPAPESRAHKRLRLYAAYRRRSTLRYALAHYGCRQRVKHRQRVGPTCRRWFAEGRARNHEIAQLHREGIT
jgi:lysozyme